MYQTRDCQLWRYAIMSYQLHVELKRYSIVNAGIVTINE